MRSILQFLTDVIFNKIYKKTLIGDKTFDKYNLQKKKKKEGNSNEASSKRDPR